MTVRFHDEDRGEDPNFDEDIMVSGSFISRREIVYERAKAVLLILSTGSRLLKVGRVASRRAESV